MYSLLKSDNNIFSIDEIDVLCENLSFSNEVINEVYILAYDFLNFRSQNFDFTKEDMTKQSYLNTLLQNKLIIGTYVDSLCQLKVKEIKELKEVINTLMKSKGEIIK